MSIQPRRKAPRGFTIVELLVVIGILAILATIVVTSYTSIQNRTRAENAKNNALYLQRKLQSYYQINNTFPTPSTTTTQLNALTATKLNGVLTLGTPTTNTGEKTAKLDICSSGGVGYRITYWDYVSNTLPGTPQITGGTSPSSCGAWTTAT